MFKLYRNSDVGRTLAQFLIVTLIGWAIFFYVISTSINSINEKIISTNSALVGGIVKDHPELEDDIAKYFTKPIDYSNEARGGAILKNYGYDINMGTLENKAIGSEYLSLFYKILFILFILAIAIFILIQRGFNRLLSSVSDITMAASKVVEGEYIKLPNSYEEGDIAVLTNCFNNMVDSLEKNITLLKNEKVFLNNLISDISHQLKTPLASLIMFNDLLGDYENSDKAMIKDWIDSSREQLDRMEWLILNLLKLARLQAGAIKFKMENASVENTIKKAIAPFKIILEDKKQNLIIKGDKHIHFNHDSQWMAEALSNLIKNSIEHSEVGSSILIDFYQGPVAVTIKVVDEGVGIKKKDLSKIFDRFYRGKNPANPNSIGIGLALTRSIVEGQGGDISIYSEEGIGTTFIITMYKEGLV